VHKASPLSAVHPHFHRWAWKLYAKDRGCETWGWQCRACGCWEGAREAEDAKYLAILYWVANAPRWLVPETLKAILDRAISDHDA
jgi:hypothetical protein